MNHFDLGSNSNSATAGAAMPGLSADMNSLSAMLAAIAAANSPLGLNSPPPSVTAAYQQQHQLNTSIPSPQSAFAIIQQKQRSQQVNIGAGNILLPSPNTSSISSTSSSSSTSAAVLGFGALNCSQGQHQPSPPNAAAVNVCMASALPSALEQFSKIFASAGAAGIDPATVLAKIHQHLASEMTSFSTIANSLSTTSTNSAASNAALAPLMSTLPTVASNGNMCQPPPTTNVFNPNNNFLLESSLSVGNVIGGNTKNNAESAAKLEMSALIQQQQQQQSDGPPRKIRRRRNKSPGSRDPSVSSINSPQSAKPDGKRLTEQQQPTPEDPLIISSPPSLHALQAQLTDDVGGYPPLSQDSNTTDDGSAKIGAKGYEFSAAFYNASANNYGPSTNAEPNNADSSEDAKNRQKSCRVCGDTASGYNFNVITCESCKAFFRRNANKQKEFKCPYSDDCQINIVSRRFCQKCRLRKCFAEGMKKEWILNEDQLRRRKNSRLKGVKCESEDGFSQQASPMASPVSSIGSPMSVPSPMFSSAVAANKALLHHRSSIDMNVAKSDMARSMELNRRLLLQQHQQLQQLQQQQQQMQQMQQQQQKRHLSEGLRLSASETSSQGGTSSFFPRPVADTLMSSPMLSPLGVQFSSSMLSPASVATPPSGIMMPKVEPPSSSSTAATEDQYNPNIIHSLNQLTNPSALPFPASVHSLLFKEQQKQSTLEDYQKLLRWKNGEEAAASSNSQELSSPSNEKQGTVLANQQQQQNFPAGIQSPTGESMVKSPPSSVITSLTDIDQQQQCPSGQVSRKNSIGTEMAVQRMRLMEKTIHEALQESPEDLRELVPANSIPQDLGRPSSGALVYQLSQWEQHEIDIVKDAYSCMDEPLDTNQVNKAAPHLNKAEHSPVDIMNLMNITMRRVVKMAKKLPCFNELSQDGKLALLKGSMIDMLCIRGVSVLDSEKQCWRSAVTGNQSISCNIFDKLNDSSQKNRFMHFYNTLHEQIRKNSMAINLIGLIVLFDHSKSLSEESDKVISKKHCGTYLRLLKRHLESIHGEEALAIISTVNDALQELNTISTKAATIFVGRVRPGETESLPTEFFKTTGPVSNAKAEDEKAPVSSSPPSEPTRDVVTSSSSTTSKSC